MNKTFLLLTFCLSLFLFNCSGKNPGKSIIIQGIDYSPTTFDPAIINDLVTGQIFPHIIETLVTLDKQSRLIQPCLAERWEISNNFRKYKFWLKGNVFFHDTTIVTSYDVSASFLRQFDNTNSFNYNRKLNLFEYNYKNIIQKIEITNQSEIIFYLKRQDALFLYMLSSPFSAGIISQTSLKKNIENKIFMPIGTGPYYFQRRDENGLIKLKAFEKYHNYKPIIKELLFYAKNQSDLERLMFIDSINVLYRIRGSMVERFRTNTSLNINVLPPLSTFYLGFNLNSKLLSDKQIRKYISSSIDKLGLISITNRTNAEAAQGPLPPGLWNSKVTEKHEQRNTLSGEDNNLKNISFRVIGYVPSERNKFFFNAIIQSIKKLNITIKEDYYSDWESYFEERKKNNYDLFFSTWRSDILGDPYFFLYDLFHSESTNNGFHYKNVSVDSLLDLARITESRDQRNIYYQQILDIIEEDVPAVFIHHPKEVFVVNKRFSPIIIDPYGYIHFEKIITY